MFRNTNPRVIEYRKKGEDAVKKMAQLLDDNKLDEIKQLIIDLEIACPISGTRNWTDVRQFNLMFKTNMGSVTDDSDSIYLRPETAQGIFVNFMNVRFGHF